MIRHPAASRIHVFQFFATSLGGYCFTGYCEALDCEERSITLLERFYHTFSFECGVTHPAVCVHRLGPLHLSIEGFRLLVNEIQLPESLRPVGEGHHR